MVTSKRRTSYQVHSGRRMWSQSQWTARKGIALHREIQTSSNWVNFSQRSSPGPPFIPPQHPENLLLWGDRLCCLAAERKRQAKAFFLAEKSALKNLWEHWKNTHGAGRCGGGSGFLPFWLGFILPSRKRNMHRAFHIKSVCPQAEHHSGLQSQTSPRNTYTTTEPEERCIQRDRSCHIKKKYILAH